MDQGHELVSLGVRLLDLVRAGARTTTYEPATLLALVEVPDRVRTRWAPGHRCG